MNFWKTTTDYSILLAPWSRKGKSQNSVSTSFLDSYIFLKPILLDYLAIEDFIIYAFKLQYNQTLFISIKNSISLANLRWPTRPQPIGGHYLHTRRPL